jgi:hypothetical protein
MCSFAKPFSVSRLNRPTFDYRVWEGTESTFDMELIISPTLWQRVDCSPAKPTGQFLDGGSKLRKNFRQFRAFRSKESVLAKLGNSIGEST